MLFVSTRGKTDLVCSAHAITRGLADDGGLFVPQKFPELSLGEIVSMRSMTYKERAVAILSLFLTDYTKEELCQILEQYTSFLWSEVGIHYPISLGIDAKDKFINCELQKY